MRLDLILGIKTDEICTELGNDGASTDLTRRRKCDRKDGVGEGYKKCTLQLQANLDSYQYRIVFADFWKCQFREDSQCVGKRAPP